MGTFLAYSISRFNVGGKNFRYLVLTIRMVAAHRHCHSHPDVLCGVDPLHHRVAAGRAHQPVRYLPRARPAVCGDGPAVRDLDDAHFIDEVPYTLEHAARIMGAGRIYTLRRVVLPLVASGMMVTFLFIFILNWSEFLLALTLTQPQVSTLPVLLNKFQSAVEGRLYGPQAAIGTVITLPVVVLGILIQKHLITGFSFGMLRK